VFAAAYLPDLLCILLYASCASAELGPRHTGCHDAAKYLEIILAMRWWWLQCKGDTAFDELLTKQGGRMAAVTGVTALQSRYNSCIQEFGARIHARDFKVRMSSRRQPETFAQGITMQLDLVQLQRRDPTYHSYKSMLRYKAYAALLKWTAEDDQDAGAVSTPLCTFLAVLCARFCHAQLSHFLN